MTRHKTRVSKQRMNKYRTGFFFALPCLIILALMMLTPLMRTVVYSFSKIKFPQLTTSFYGFTNYERVLSRSEITTVMTNTLTWIFGAVVLRFVMGFSSALLFNGTRKRTKTARVLVLLPWTIPSVVAANTWRWLYQPELGLLNHLLTSANMPWLAQNWLGHPSTAMASVLVAYTWSGFPFVMMMILAGIQGIPDELYESGKIDGANGLQLFWYITLPSLKNVLLAVLMLEITSGLNSFDLLFTMTGGGPGGVTEILGLMIHRIGFTNLEFGQASALSMVVIFIALAVFLVSGPVQRKSQKGGV